MKTPQNSQKDWTEDSILDNCVYNNFCVYCGCLFIGNKKRVVCKECDTEISEQINFREDE